MNILGNYKNEGKEQKIGDQTLTKTSSLFLAATVAGEDSEYQFKIWNVKRKHRRTQMNHEIYFLFGTNSKSYRFIVYIFCKQCTAQTKQASRRVPFILFFHERNAFLLYCVLCFLLCLWTTQRVRFNFDVRRFVFVLVRRSLSRDSMRFASTCCFTVNVYSGTHTHAHCTLMAVNLNCWCRVAYELSIEFLN